MFDNLIQQISNYLDSGSEDDLEYLEDEISVYSEDKLELISNLLSLSTAYMTDDRVVKRVKRLSQICIQSSYV